MLFFNIITYFFKKVKRANFYLRNVCIWARAASATAFVLRLHAYDEHMGPVLMNTAASVTNSYKKVTKWLQFGNKMVTNSYKVVTKQSKSYKIVIKNAKKLQFGNKMVTNSYKL